jgi:hypothetical protein
MDQKIAKIYSENFYPSLNELYKILQQEGISITKAKVKEFLDLQLEQQITKETKIMKKDDGAIIASYPDQLWQLDIFILQKYVKYNKGYRDMLCAVDVFTRRAYVVSMKQKDLESVIKAIKMMFKLYGVPDNIMSDSDSTFTSHEFQKLMKEKEITHDMVPVGDHKSLGIVDRFARTLKTKLTKIFIARKETNWIDYIDKVVEKYNNTEHSGIGDIKPIHANEPYYVHLIAAINKEKSLKNERKADLTIGDKVRVVEMDSIFQKGTEGRFSDDVYTVKHIQGKNITLNNGVVKKRYFLLHVPNDTVGSVEQNVIKKVNKVNRAERKDKKEGIDTANIIVGGRRR